MDEQSQVEAGGARRWMNSSPWRLEEVHGGHEQYPVESRFVVRHISACAFGFFGLIRFGLYGFRFYTVFILRFIRFYTKYGSVLVITILFRFGFGNNQNNQS